MNYNREIHVPVTAVANRSLGISYQCNRHGEPRFLLATREDGTVRRFRAFVVWDPDAIPKGGPHLGPGAFFHAVTRSVYEKALAFVAV